MTATAPAAPTLKPINDIPLTRALLKQVLSDLSERLYRSFRRQVRLVVHGGAVMVLYPSFKHRDSTQDVDYIHRSFVKEYRALGFPDAEQRLRGCIAETAYKFNLGADWMNDHADVALPIAQECVQSSHIFPSPNKQTDFTSLPLTNIRAYSQQGRRFDPIFYDTIQQQNPGALTVFSERGLALVAVPWPWAVALKLVRYAKKDPEDCAAVLRLGAFQRGFRWTVDVLEHWLSERCWPMRYSLYSPQRKAQLRERLKDALARAFPEPQPLLPLTTTYQAYPYPTHAQTQFRTTQVQQLRSPSSMPVLSPPSNFLSPLSSSLFTPLQQQLPRTNSNVPLYFL